MTYKVTYSFGNNYSVKKTKTNDYKVGLSNINQIVEPVELDQLTDVEISGNNDKYVLMYDAPTGKWKDVNPDAVLSAAATEPIQPGLPDDFVDTLDVDLDNRIDLDAGTF
jgi:hypothetical protein